MGEETRHGRLALPASGSTAAALQVVHRTPGERGVRAAAILLGSWILTPLVFFVPPHVVWPVLVFVAGLYFARREWRGEFVVRSFEGVCPRCGEPITVEAGARLRGRQRVECFSCHREPELVLDEAGE